MPRKKRDHSREVLPDPKFKDVVVTETVNTICKHGKKGLAERAFYAALDTIQEKTNSEPLEFFRKALANVRPIVEVRSRRVGGATYQVPTEVRADRSQALAIRWIIEAANARGERKLAIRLANEIMEAAQGKGGAIRQREDTHRMADANKAFAHFKW